MTLLSVVYSLVSNPGKGELPSGQKKIQSNIRTLKGHTGAITALHCVTRREVWDLVGDREDAGLFISGSTDCSVSDEVFFILHFFLLYNYLSF